ncbi:MAG: APC family permease, partial [Fimbriimonadaceae bacterium]|nr:APC family permease [Alphaproteobacteria bacterium]
CTGAALVEFSKIAPSAGSMQVFLKRGFGNSASIAGGIVLLIGYLCLQSAVAALFGGWTSQLLSAYLGLSVPWLLLTVTGVAVCTAFMVRGVGLSIKATWILFLVEFALVLLIALAVVLTGGAKGLSLEPLSLGAFSSLPMMSIGMALVFATFSFVGFEGAISFAEETPNPQKAMPVAVLGGVGVIALLYVFAMYAVVMGFGTDQMAAVAKDSEPIATLAGLYAGPLKPFLELAIWTSIVANLMAAGNANARILFNMARENMLPQSLALIHQTNKTPHRAIMTFMGLTLVPAALGWIGGWDYLATFGNIAGLGALLALLIYMAAALALPAFILRQKQIPMRPFIHLIVPVLGAAVWLVPLWGALQPGQSFPFNLYPWIAVVLIVAAWIFATLRSSKAAEKTA